MAEFVTSNGVVLELRGVPSLVTLAVLKAHPKPQVPIYVNEEKGGREEENPNDPHYLQELEQYNIDLVNITTDTYLANGVTVKSVPDGYADIGSSEWVEPLVFSGIDIPADGVGRRVAYLKYYLLNDNDDVAKVTQAVAIAGGVVTEEQVEQAAESFRDNAEGDTNTEDSNAQNNGLGDTPDNVTRIGNRV